jgi:hypothetical protein
MTQCTGPEPTHLEILGEHAPAVREQVRVQGSLHPDKVPPARVYVDTRLGDRDLWRPVLVLSVAHLLRDVHGKRF